MADNEYFWVQAVKGVDHNGVQGDNLVLLFEKDAVHPNGEAFIAGPLPVQVGDSAAVNRLLKDGDIQKVDAPKKSEQADPLAAERTSLAARAKQLEDQAAALDKRQADLDAETARIEGLRKK